MADIKQIKLPSGSTFNIKDETARNQMEVKANKVTSISADSTDTQYPSAKAVYDALQSSGAQSVSYLFSDANADGNIVITEQVVGSLDGNSY